MPKLLSSKEILVRDEQENERKGDRFEHGFYQEKKKFTTVKINGVWNLDCNKE